MEQKPELQLIFQGCGGLYNYVLGIVKHMQLKYELPNTIFTGVSAGNYPMIMLALDNNLDEAWGKFNMPFLESVSKYKTRALFNWNKECQKATYNFLPNNIHQLLNNKCYISLSKVNSWWNSDFENKLISQWDDKEDVVNCIQASAFIPIFDIKASFNYKNNYYVDGSLTNGEPCVIPKYQIPTLVIHYNMFRTFPDRYMWCYSDKNWANYLYNLGYLDAKKNDYIFSSYFLSEK